MRNALYKSTTAAAAAAASTATTTTTCLTLTLWSSNFLSPPSRPIKYKWGMKNVSILD